jgi:restriction system protein
MARKRSKKGPRFTRFLGPVINALQDLGGSGVPSEVVDWITAELDISEEEQNLLLASGQPRYVNDIHWARYYLAKSGYIDSSKRGIWSLTTKGLNATLSRSDAVSIFRQVQAEAKEEEDEITHDSEALEEDENATPEPMGYRVKLMGILRTLPPEGFERLSQRLLREAGFQKLTVTGRPGDGGIDGNGLLQINPFVSFQVLFQCKRYSGSVGASQVRDFRGAMMGRADKGIIITTGTFTKDAKREAVRDGVPAIELVNGEKLLDMLEQLELGLKRVTTYEVDSDFFDEFK